ncbi:MAG: anthrone oxygenase family protein [Cyanobacteria bacterium P01_F01_bin.143]
MIKRVSAITAIISIAAFAGNMINIGMSDVGYWQSMEPIEFMRDFKVKFPFLLFPTATTLLPALIATILSVVFSRKSSAAQQSWIIALLGLLLIVIITRIYHLPTNLAFMKLEYGTAEAASKLRIWVLLHWVRVIAAITAATFAVLGFKKSNW